MDEDTAQTIVRVIAGAYALGATITFVLACFAIVALFAKASVTPMELSILSVLLLACAFQGVLAIGLWSYNRVARVICIILSTLSLLLGVLIFLFGIFIGPLVAGDPAGGTQIAEMGIGIIAIDCTVLWLLAFQRDIKTLFAVKPKAA